MGNGLDIAIILTTLAVSYMGWRTGGVRMVVSLLGAGLGVFLAGHLYQEVAAYLPEGIGTPGTVRIVTFAAIALGVFIASLVLSAVMRGVLRVLFLGWVDRGAGVVAGAAVALVLWAGALGISRPYLTDDFGEAVDQSRLAELLLEEVPGLANIVPQPVKSYVEDKFSFLVETWPPVVRGDR